MLGRKWLAVTVGATALALPLLANQAATLAPARPSADIDETAVAAIRAAGGAVEFVNDGPVGSAVAIKLAYRTADEKKRLFNLLGAFPRLKRLEVLNASPCDADLKCLEDMHDLESLHLFFSDVSDEGLKHLRSLHNLRELNLDNCGLVTDAGMKTLGGLRRLEGLDVSETHVTDRGLESIVRLPNLRVLGLINTEVTDAGVERLAGMNRLEDLDLSFNGFDGRLTDKSLMCLVGLKSLRRLGIVDAGMTDEGIEAFRKRRPDVIIFR